MTAPGGADRRDRPPAPGPVEPFRFPPYERHRLANGLTVVAARSRRAPLVALALVVPAGSAHDPQGGAGTAALTSALLDEGTDGATALEIADRVADLGGGLATGASRDVAYLELEVLRHQAVDALELVAELATRPTFPAEELERQRRRHLAELLRRRSDPGRLADEHLARAIYGEAPYGRPLLGDEATLTALGRDDVERFHRAFYGLAGSFLVAAGDLAPADLFTAAERVLGGLPGGEAPASPAFEVLPPDGVRVVVVDRPHAAQTELRLGHSGVPRNHPDFLTLAAVNGILGGKFTSRINLNLRERHGYTYGASSRFAGRQGPGPFVVRTAVGTPVAGAAAREVVGELERIREAEVDREELDDAKSYLIGTFPYTLQTVSGVADRLETIAIHDLRADYYEVFPRAVAEIDRAAVLAAARRHLRPAELAIVAVGPADELEPQLRGLGEVRVETAGEPAPAPEAAAAATGLGPEA